MSLLQSSHSFVFSTRADLDIVDYLCSPCGPRHASGGTFVLYDIGRSVPSHHALSHFEPEAVLTDLRFGQLGSDGCFKLRVAGSDGMSRC